MSTAPPSSTSSQPQSWLAFIVFLPQQQTSGRMTVLRTLESLGCAVLREGAYLLPDTPHNRAGLERLADYTSRLDGTAQVLSVAGLDLSQTQQLQKLFDRTSQYESLIKTVEALSAGFGIADPVALRRVLGKQRGELDRIRLLDFFRSPLAAAAEQSLIEMERKVHALLFPQHQETGHSAAEDDGPYFQRVWATRKPLFADRLASAWLIRRFIDPEAQLRWLDKGEACPEGALSFAYEDAKFSNSSTCVTFEELLFHFDLVSQPALARIGTLVHTLDAGDGEVVEAPGVETMLEGARRRARNEDELLAESEKTFDLLYEAYYELPPKL
ncbi:MAG TPA: chromate resistance protein ChrB domain-containing protein [Burkholderiales bacterium]|nr:chromate resistance protein ChrB domain-containing protein [Burkholderiales bacterium]